MDKNSIDFSKMTEQTGDERVVPFSFTTDPESVQIEQASCWLTYTIQKLMRLSVQISTVHQSMLVLLKERS